MTRIVRTSQNFEREPMRSPWGFKGGFLTESWQSIVRLETDSGHSAVGLGAQSVLWSDADVFVENSESAGNAQMLLLTAAALQQVKRAEYSTPIELLNELLPLVHARGKVITDHEALRLTFALNSLVPVDCAAWRIAALERGQGAKFEDLIPEFARPAMKFRHDRITSVPAVGYGMAIEDVRALVDDGFYILKIKIGSDPRQDGDQDAMLAWDKDRMTAIHGAVEHARLPQSPTRRVLYYLDANGRYDSSERVLRLLDHLAEIDALAHCVLLEEPFPEHVRAEVGDFPIPVVADESAHTAQDVIDRINLGYGAIALKPAAKTLSMSFQMVQAAFDRGIPCFCADLTVNPALVDWNKVFAAHLAPLPGLAKMILETNGFQNYRNWKSMVERHPLPDADWIWPIDGEFQLSDEFYAQSGGMFGPLPYYERSV